MRAAGFLILLVLLQACSDQPQPTSYKEPFQGSGWHKVYITNHGWHTGLIMPASQVYSTIPALYARFSQAPYLEFGWGDQGFYQAKEITAGLALEAITIPTDTVLHVVAVPAIPQNYFVKSDMQALCLDNAEMDALLKFIKSSFGHDNKKIVALGKGIYGNSQFYKGSGKYYLTNTCNKWTAKALKSIGMNITPLFYFRAESIMNYLKQHPKTLKNLATACDKQD